MVQTEDHTLTFIQQPGMSGKNGKQGKSALSGCTDVNVSRAIDAAGLFLIIVLLKLTKVKSFSLYSKEQKKNRHPIFFWNVF